MRLRIIGKALLLLLALICAIVSLVYVILTIILISEFYTFGIFRDLFFRAMLLLFSTLYFVTALKNGFFTSLKSIAKITVEDIRAYEERKKEEAEAKKKQRIQEQIQALQEQLNNEETE